MSLYCSGLLLDTRSLPTTAEAGYVKSMDMIEKMYMTYGIGSKDEYEQIVRAHQKRQEDMKCDTRKAIVIRRANKPEDEMRF